jgi:hypothetical protein
MQQKTNGSDDLSAFPTLSILNMAFGRLRRVWEKIKGGLKSVWNKGLKPALKTLAPTIGTAIGGAIGGPSGAAFGSTVGGAVSGFLGGKPAAENSGVSIGRVGEFLRDRH